MSKEKRYTVEPVELRSDDGGKSYIGGRAIIYNKPYPVYPGYVEFIAPGAMEGCDLSDVICSFNHTDEKILGRSVNGEGTLSITPDEQGVKFEVEENNTTASKDCAENIRLKNIRGCSFEFSAKEVDYQYDVPQADGTTATVRTILKFGKLYAVNPVVYPAYRDTDVQVIMRSVDQNKPPVPQMPNTYFLDKQLKLK